MTRQEKRGLKDIAHAERNKEKQKFIVRKEQGKERPRTHVDADHWEEFEDALIRPRISAVPQKAAIKVETDTEIGEVIGIGPGVCKVLFASGPVMCRSIIGLAIGDRVAVTKQLQVSHALPRTTMLSRPDPGNAIRERVIAANIEQVVIVVSVSNPPLRAGLIDRYLIAIEKGGAQAVLCVNKCDLIEGDADLDAIRPYEELGLPVFRCSAETGAGVAELRDALAGALCVFVGHSGVGKSSLLNAIAPEVRAETGEVSAANKKGRHTTTGSTLYALENGARIIDTPGIREFGLWDVSAEKLRDYFHEFDAYAAGCEFSNCSHSDEELCAVRRAAENGDFPQARYAAYLRILEGL